MDKECCKTCKWWHSVTPDNPGVCQKLTPYTHSGRTDAIAWMGQGAFFSKPDFYCNQWEGKTQ